MAAYERNQTCLVLQNLPPCTSSYLSYTLLTSGNVNQCANNGCHLCLIIRKKREHCSDPLLRDDSLSIDMIRGSAGSIMLRMTLEGMFAPEVELARTGIYFRVLYFQTWETG